MEYLKTGFLMFDKNRKKTLDKKQCIYVIVLYSDGLRLYIVTIGKSKLAK